MEIKEAFFEFFEAGKEFSTDGTSFLREGVKLGCGNQVLDLPSLASSLVENRVPFSWREGWITLYEEVVALGSRKSGNWGHKGRPGKRGGSAPRSSFVIDSAFSARLGLSRKLIDEVMTKIPEDHLRGLNGVLASPPRSADSWEDFSRIASIDGGHAVAVYDPVTKNIHLNEDFIGSVNETLPHEIGHHVTRYDGVDRSKSISDDARLTYGKLGFESSVWNRAVMEKLWDLNPAILPLLGLRSYVKISTNELAADTYKTYINGTSAQKSQLAHFLGLDSLSEVFG